MWNKNTPNDICNSELVICNLLNDCIVVKLILAMHYITTGMSLSYNDK